MFFFLSSFDRHFRAKVGTLDRKNHPVDGLEIKQDFALSVFHYKKESSIHFFLRFAKCKKGIIRFLIIRTDTMGD